MRGREEARTDLVYAVARHRTGEVDKDTRTTRICRAIFRCRGEPEREGVGAVLLRSQLPELVVEAPRSPCRIPAVCRAAKLVPLAAVRWSRSSLGGWLEEGDAHGRHRRGDHAGLGRLEQHGASRSGASPADGGRGHRSVWSPSSDNPALRRFLSFARDLAARQRPRRNQ